MLIHKNLLWTSLWFLTCVADPDPGSRIRCLFDPWIRDPGSGMDKILRIRIQDEQPRSYFRELRNYFWVKILKFFDADPGSGIRDGKNSDPGWKKLAPGIGDKHPTSATLFLSVVKLKMVAVSLPDLLGFFKTCWIASKHEMHKIMVLFCKIVRYLKLHNKILCLSKSDLKKKLQTRVNSVGSPSPGVTSPRAETEHL
jgi:hypothetical protein